MAATESADATVTCPLPGCDYSGSPRSVESHISGKTDDLHRGEVGRSYRESLESTGSEDRGEVDVEGVEQWDVESDEESDKKAEQEGEEAGNDESERSGGEAPSEGTDTPETDQEAGSLAIPTPVDSKVVMGAVALLFLAVVVYAIWSDVEDDQDDQEESVAATGQTAGETGLAGG